MGDPCLQHVGVEEADHHVVAGRMRAEEVVGVVVGSGGEAGALGG
jgi:hypothetical protein